MPYTPPPELAGLSLAQIAEAVAEHRLPPVEQWSPEHVGESHMRIAADGITTVDEERLERIYQADLQGGD